MKAVLKILLKAPIRFYAAAISPIIPARCRFEPSCSSYALEAIDTHGALKGAGLAFKRVCKCHPFSAAHGYDPVPDHAPEKESAKRD